MIKTLICDGLNEQQKQAVENPVLSCTKIVAGAGTGKTKVISRRFVKLVGDLAQMGVDNPVNRLLVITFTDKAATEMKERILSELSSYGVDSLGQDLWISTFHGFCSRILRKHSINVGLSPSFTLGDEKDLRRIFDNIIKKIRYNEANLIDDIGVLSNDLGLNSDILSVKNLKKLTKTSNLDAIFDEVFGIIKKIKSLGIDADEFLDKTYKATEDFTSVILDTPFGFATRDEYLSAWEQHYRTYVDEFCCFDEKKSGAFDLIAGKKQILDKNRSQKADKWTCAMGMESVLQKTKDQELYLVQVVALIYAVYQNELSKLDMVDFDDLINKTIKLFKANSSLRAYYRELFSHLIIDEFQDSNGAQLELIELLLSDLGPNITFVGDRKQSIYGFRFAQMENLDVLHKYIEQKYGQKYPEIKLVTNYRSMPEVLEAVNFVTQEQLKLDENLGAFKQNPSVDEKYVKITTLQGVSDVRDHRIKEAKYIAQEIARLKIKNGADYKDFAILVKSHSQAELVDKYLAELGIPSIKKVNMSFFRGGTIRNAIALLRLAFNMRDEIAFVKILEIEFAQSEIYQLKAALDKLLVDEDASRMNFSDKIIFALENRLWQNLDIDHKLNNFIRKLFDTLLDLKKEKFSLIQIYYKLITNITPYCAEGAEQKYKNESDLTVFGRIIADFAQKQNYTSLKNLIDYIDKIKDDKSFELPSMAQKQMDAVNILTIFASKGLEFGYVFLLSITNSSNTDKNPISFDLQYGNKPGFGVICHKYGTKSNPKTALYRELWKKPRDKNEQLRLFYVALSRAEKYLNILSFEPYNSKTKPAEYVSYCEEAFMSEIFDASCI